MNGEGYRDPAVDVMQELRKMKSWLDSNPRRRKTKQGILRFANSWLTREQDKGGSYKNSNSGKPKNNNKFNNFHQREYDFDKLEAGLLGVQGGGQSNG